MISALSFPDKNTKDTEGGLGLWPRPASNAPLVPARRGEEAQGEGGPDVP